MGAFERYDTDKSGEVDTHELGELLASFGIEPLRHVLDAVIAEVDGNASGLVDIDEFYKVMEIIRFREGFTSIEVAIVENAFQKFDRDNSGDVDAHELRLILTYLHYPEFDDTVSQVLREVDVDGSGSLNLRELLLCMRKIRDLELQRVKRIMAQHDVDRSGSIDRHELQAVLRCLGYYPSQEAIADAVREAGIQEEELDLSAFWALLQTYRRREGFTDSDIKAVREVFLNFAGSLDGSIKFIDRENAVRWMGFQHPFEVQQLITEQVDVDGSGELEMHEFSKMIRMCIDWNVNEWRVAFQSYDSGGRGLLTAAEAACAFREVNCIIAPEIW